MHCSHISNKKINSLQDRCLGVVYNNKQLPFTELLTKDDSVDMYKSKKPFSTSHCEKGIYIYQQLKPLIKT